MLRSLMTERRQYNSPEPKKEEEALLQVIGAIQGRPVRIEKVNVASSEEDRMLKLSLSRRGFWSDQEETRIC